MQDISDFYFQGWSILSSDPLFWESLHARSSVIDHGKKAPSWVPHISHDKIGPNQSPHRVLRTTGLLVTSLSFPWAQIPLPTHPRPWLPSRWKCPQQQIDHAIFIQSALASLLICSYCLLPSIILKKICTSLSSWKFSVCVQKFIIFRKSTFLFTFSFVVFVSYLSICC